jgi:glutamate dehydrogenase/leucine dehydrogenase
MVNEYEKLTGEKSKASFTGKPINDSGSEGRGQATGLGGYLVFDALRQKLGIARGARIAIQGVGNVGGTAAEIFSKNGYKIIALSDSRGGVYNPNGLDIGAVEAYKHMHGSLKGYREATAITNAQLLTLQTDILIPAALENQITKTNAAKIKAKVVLELANGPTTPEADDILLRRKIHVIPDILANAGGVIVSYFEWEQNRKGEHWSEQRVHEELATLLKKETLGVWRKAGALSTDLRRAAFVIALHRLEQKVR